MNLHIAAPCHETWDAMVPNVDGRHCEVCTKTVIDVTAMPAPRARAFLAEEVPRRLAQGESICVRATTDHRARLLHPGRRLLTNGMAAMLAMAMGSTLGANVAHAEEAIPTPSEEPQLMGEICPPAPGPVRAEVMGRIAFRPQVATVTLGTQSLRVDSVSDANLATLLTIAAARCQSDLPLPDIAPEVTITLRDGRRYALLSARILTGPEGGLDDPTAVAAIRALVEQLPTIE